MAENTKDETAVFIKHTGTEPDHAARRVAAKEKEILIIEDREKDTPERGNWDRKLDFILSLIGYSVGVSNLWRFPYLCLRNGGGAFLVPFFIFLLLTGIPLFYLEVSLGQFSGTSPLWVWKLCPLFKGIGWGSCIVSGITSVYYVTVIAWVLFFFVNAFYPTLPWSSCENWWNTDTCISPRLSNNFTNETISSNLTNLTNSYNRYFQNQTQLELTNSSAVGDADGKTAAEEFWQYYVLRKSDGLENVGSLQPHLVACLFVSWLLVFLCLIKGIKSLGKVVYVTALMPYVLLTILLIRGLMLPGAVDGIWFYVYPDFSKLSNYSVWVEAALQVFFSLGPAWGSLITMASFNKFHNNCFRDAVIASLADGLTSFYSGFVIFSVVGFMAKEAGVDVRDVATQGPGLALVAYPEAITKLPLPQLWAVLFFLMLLMLGLDSQFGMFENLVAGIVDAFPHKLRRYRVFVTAGVAFVSFLLGLPLTLNGGIYIFQLMDWFTSAFCLIITSFLECVIIGWIYGVDRFGKDIEMMLGRTPGPLMKFAWCISTPLIMAVIFIAIVTGYKMPTYDGYTYPAIARVFGFMLSLLPIIPIPTVMVWELYKAKGSIKERLLQTLRPAANWKPAKKEYQSLYKTENHAFTLPLKSLVPCRQRFQ